MLLTGVLWSKRLCVLFRSPPTRGQQGKDSVPFLHSLPVFFFFFLSCFYLKAAFRFQITIVVFRDVAQQACEGAFQSCLRTWKVWALVLVRGGQSRSSSPPSSPGRQSEILPRKQERLQPAAEIVPACFFPSLPTERVPGPLPAAVRLESSKGVRRYRWQSKNTNGSGALLL